MQLIFLIETVKTVYICDFLKSYSQLISHSVDKQFPNIHMYKSLPHSETKEKKKKRYDFCSQGFYSLENFKYFLCQSFN